ncbi:MAG: cyclic nucleotide-binding domain-containing protein [Deltaproteobacteria bacterium]|nr:cyclic nucleotide-binding domain-containing protein [Deltaproteobacteria bacterium]
MYLFKGVSKEALRALSSLAPPVSFKPGVTLFNQGDPSDVALLLLEGKLGVEIAIAGQHREVGTINVGEIVGETALFAREGKRSATVRALQPSTCLIISNDLLIEGNKNSAVIAIERHLLSTLARRVRRTNQEINKLWKELGVTEKPRPTGSGWAKKLKQIFQGSR